MPSGAADRIPSGDASPADLAAVRTLLEHAGYTEARVCERLNLHDIHSFRSLSEGRARTRIRDALDLLIRLFLDCEPVSSLRTRSMLGAGGGALERVGLLQSHGPGRVRATALLYPAHGLWIASDSRHARAPGRRGPREDVVYPAIAESTRAFVQGLPGKRPGRALDLCTGTGIGALLLAPHADDVTAVDITERAVAFARFNAALNGMSQVRVERGDLYEPVQGMTFDTIVAHPPFVPAASPRYIYRDGGEDGERVTARIVAGLPAHLRAGGLFYCSCAATDRADPLEMRLRSMLGPEHNEFDVAVVPRTVQPVEAWCAELARASGGLRRATRLLEAFRTHAVRSLVIGWIVIMRHAAPAAGLVPPTGFSAARPVGTGRAAAVTLRRPAGEEAAADAVARTLCWEHQTGPAAIAAVLAARPHRPEGLRLHLIERAHADGWSVEARRLTTVRPFAAALDASPGIVAFLEQCDGRRTVREITRTLRERGVIPDPVPDESIAQTVRSLLAEGFLEADA